MRAPEQTDMHVGAPSGRRASAGGGRGGNACIVRARKVEVHRPGRVPPAAWVHPLLTLFISEDVRTVAAAPPLHALFELLDQVGAVEVHRRTAARIAWRLVEARGHARVALRLEISEPSDARGVVDITMDVADYERVWQEIREGRWVGITSSRRLLPHKDGSEADIAEVFASCIPLDSAPPPALSEMDHARR